MFHTSRSKKKTTTKAFTVAPRRKKLINGLKNISILISYTLWWDYSEVQFFFFKKMTLNLTFRNQMLLMHIERNVEPNLYMCSCTYFKSNIQVLYFFTHVIFAFKSVRWSLFFLSTFLAGHHFNYTECTKRFFSE